MAFNNAFLTIVDLYLDGRTEFSRAGCSCRVTEAADGWKAETRIPMPTGAKAARLSVIRIKDGKQVTAWGGTPLKYRLLLGMYNPQETGSLMFG